VRSRIDGCLKHKRSKVPSRSDQPMLDDSPNPSRSEGEELYEKPLGNLSRRIPLDRVPEHIQRLRERFYREVIPAALDRVLADQNRQRENVRSGTGTPRRNLGNEHGDGDSLAGPSGQSLADPGRNRGKKKNHSS
jgi:hypothetical protein